MAKSIIYAGTSTVAAKICGNESTALDEAAAVILATAQGLAGEHVKSGRYLRSLGVSRIKGKNGVTDRMVYSDDPAAESIEWGHSMETARGPRWVAGQFILTRASRA